MLPGQLALLSRQAPVQLRAAPRAKTPMAAAPLRPPRSPHGGLRPDRGASRRGSKGGKARTAPAGLSRCAAEAAPPPREAQPPPGPGREHGLEYGRQRPAVRRGRAAAIASAPRAGPPAHPPRAPAPPMSGVHMPRRRESTGRPPSYIRAAAAAVRPERAEAAAGEGKPEP